MQGVYRNQAKDTSRGRQREIRYGGTKQGNECGDCFMYVPSTGSGTRADRAGDTLETMVTGGGKRDPHVGRIP